MPAARPDRRTAPGLQDGKQEAVPLPGRFEYFYQQGFLSVAALADVLSGSRMGAEDLAQEAFVRAYRDWQRVGSYEHQAAWVRCVAANLATSGLRRRLIEARAIEKTSLRLRRHLQLLSKDDWRSGVQGCGRRGSSEAGLIWRRR